MKASGRLLRLKGRGRYEPLEIQISRQTDVIERHEKLIAYHAAVQSWTNVATLVFGIITTLALIYIGYQQYEISNRQVSLEYAKVSPLFSVKVPDFYHNDADIPFPSSIKITLSRGEATISSLDIFQDFRISKIDHDTGEHVACTFRTKNYFVAGEGNAEVKAVRLINVQDEPTFFYPSYPGDFYTIRPEGTYVRISYEDIFGDEKVVIYGGQEADLDRLPTNEIPNAIIGEMIQADLAEDATQSYGIWKKPASGPKGEGCRKIVSEGLVIAS